MRVRHYLPIAAILLLAACARGDDSAKANDTDTDTDFSMNVTGDNGAVALKGGNSSISIDSPVFSGSLKIPGLQFGGDHMDIDGMKPFPGTKFTNVNVDARDGAGGEDHGVVRMDFTAPAAPDKVLGYYVVAAKEAGFETAGVAGGAVSGSKAGGSTFTVAAAPAAGGSTGTLVITDKDKG